MIISKLSGGLGNQLFQYAHGKACALKNNEKIALDISWYSGRIDRDYMLNAFNINTPIATKVDVLKTKLFSSKKYLYGDFQSEKYFKDIEGQIRNEFTLSKKLSAESELLLSAINSTNAVSIHLRGGDYARGPKAQFHGTCPPEYYSHAIEMIRTKISSPHFYIFTDDIAWAEKHITFPKPYTLVSNALRLAYEELILMSACKHHIIANSTFSWWGAWLNPKPQKIVIAPQKWFTSMIDDSKNIIPDTWIKI